MSAIAIHHRHHHAAGPHWRHVRAALAFLALAALALVMSSDRAAIDHDTSAPARPTPTPTPTPAAVAVTPHDAIDTWLAASREDLFAGAGGPYLGTCPTEAPTTPLVGLCSSLREVLDDVQLHAVGAYATDWGADLLLVRDDATGWAVAGASPWPQLGTRYDGSPWSPVTALTTWWYDRAPARYGAGAVHLQRCSDAEVILDGGAGPTPQPLLCSTLRDTSDDGTRRTYASGRAGADPDVAITVAVQTDHTWVVTAVEELGD